MPAFRDESVEPPGDPCRRVGAGAVLVLDSLIHRLSSAGSSHPGRSATPDLAKHLAKTGAKGWTFVDNRGSSRRAPRESAWLSGFSGAPGRIRTCGPSLREADYISLFTGSRAMVSQAGESRALGERLSWRLPGPFSSCADRSSSTAVSRRWWHSGLLWRGRQ